MSKFTTICHTIRSNLLIAGAEAICYSTWHNDFAIANIEDKVKNLKQHVICENMELDANDPRRSYRFDRRDTFILDNPYYLLKAPDTINEDQLKRLDFRRWDEPRAGLELFLIPLYLAPFLAPGVTVYSISGKAKVTGLDMDLDHRQGMLSFGWMLEAGKAFPEEDKTSNVGKSLHDLEAVTWAVGKWKESVANRPLSNVHRRALDTSWRSVMRHFGGDPEALVGPSHDDLVNTDKG